MRIAWFRAIAPESAPAFEGMAALIAELSAAHDVSIVTSVAAHDFVWKHFRTPYDLCVHEVDASRAQAFVWPYALHHGGVLVLRTELLRDSRTHPFRRAVLASRLVVAPHAAAAAALEDDFPGVLVRAAPPCAPSASWSEPSSAGRDPDERVPGAAVRFGVIGTASPVAARQALARARAAGAAADLIDNGPPEAVLRGADVVLALHWPSFAEPQTLALAAMAAHKPVVVFETEATADWPALDPQTWRPRGPADAPPIAVSLDPRDEEHSLVLAMRRLSADAPLRARLGASAYEWWRAHASPRRAAAEWLRILDEAAAVTPPLRPVADGTERAREILAEFGVSVDLF